MPDAVLGLDVGTSSLKALLCTADARVLATAFAEYPSRSPQLGWSEQDPDLWVAAAHKAIREVMQKAGGTSSGSIRVTAIGIDGQMHGAVLVDRDGHPVRPAILWNDSRSTLECSRLDLDIGTAEILARTGNRLLPGFTAPKIAWVQLNEPLVWAHTAQILLPKDYLRYKLGSKWHTDVSDASGTLYFDVAKRTWSSEMLRDLRIAPSLVPEVHESAAVVDALNASAAEATGLTEGTPLIAGAGDQAAGAVGTGVVDPGTLSCVLGTSGVIFAASQEFRASPDGALHAFCHAAPHRWHMMSVMLSAAGSVQWLAQDVLSCRADEVDALAQAAPEGADGLMFLPTLAGERCPYPDPITRGAFTGLTASHTRAHMARAVIEGVTASMALCLEMIRTAGVPVTDLAISGGGFHSESWTQHMADAFGAPLVRMSSNEGAALGSALLASVGAGMNPSVQAAAAAVRKESRIEPRADHRAFWLGLAERQRTLHKVLAPLARP